MLALESAEQGSEAGAIETLGDGVLYAAETVQATNAALFLHLALDGIPECLLDHDAVEEVQMSAVLLRAQGALEMRLGDLRRQHAIEQQPLHLVRWQERRGHAAQQTLRQQQPIERFPAYEVIGLHLVECFAGNHPLPHCRQKRMCPRSAAPQRFIQSPERCLAGFQRKGRPGVGGRENDRRGNVPLHRTPTRRPCAYGISSIRPPRAPPDASPNAEHPPERPRAPAARNLSADPTLSTRLSPSRHC